MNLVCSRGYNTNLKQNIYLKMDNLLMNTLLTGY